MPVPATISNSSARDWEKCSQSDVDTSTPCWVSSFLSAGTHDPQLVPARVQALIAGTSCAPPSIAEQMAPLVTALHVQICAESGKASVPSSTPPGAISATGSAGSGCPTSARSVLYLD